MPGNSKIESRPSRKRDEKPQPTRTRLDEERELVRSGGVISKPVMAIAFGAAILVVASLAGASLWQGGAWNALVPAAGIGLFGAILALWGLTHLAARHS